MGIEPTYPAWKAGALPLSYTRKTVGAVDETRTRDLHLGKVALYQMSYARKRHRYCGTLVPPVGVEPTTRGFSVRCSTN